MRAAVLGRPIAHSLSPVLHRRAYEVLGLDGWRYDAVDVGESELAAFVSGLGPEWAGLSLTMPLKRAVLPLLDETTQRARVATAANTVVFREGRRLGDNTDVPGLVAALRECGVAEVRTPPVVVGAGATAASTLVSLAELGARRVALVLRRPDAVRELSPVAEAVGLDLEAVPWNPEVAARRCAAAELVVSTTPAGATDAIADALPAETAGTLLDVVYAPWPTRLAAAWSAGGGVVAGGLDLLVHQAVLQVVAMTGVPEQRAAALVAPLRAAGLAAL